MSGELNTCSAGVGLIFAPARKGGPTDRLASQISQSHNSWGLQGAPKLQVTNVNL